MTIRTKLLNIFIAMMVAVSFMPAADQFAYAEDGEDTVQPGTAPVEQASDQTEPAFDAAGKVRGLKIRSYTYKSVQIGWTSYAQAEGYEIYRADKKTGKYKKIKTLTACKYNDTGNKTLGKDKYYKVRAYASVDGGKVYSKYSSILTARPKLKKPTTVTTTGLTDGVKISWSGVSGAEKYKVYRATSKNGDYKKIKTTKAKSCTDRSVSAGKKYYYKVRGYRMVKKKKKHGPHSAAVEGMALLGNVGGLNVTIKKSTGVVTAKWDAKKGATGYQLQRKLTGGKYVTVAKTEKRSIKDTLKKSGSYSYRVRAYATVNGKKQYGPYSVPGGRGNALAQAQSWVGCKESNGSHKKIIDVYNGYNPASGKLGYGTPWCAAFVSAVAIKTGNTEVIPVHSYCPSMLSLFPEKTYNKKYTPKGADVIFFDWNYNKVPDHVGMVEKTEGNNVTTIEGNYSDAVKRRTFKKGYSLVLAYGLPAYTVRNTVSYTAPDKDSQTEDKAAVKLASLAIAEELAGEELAGEAPGESCDAFAAEEGTDIETAEIIIDYIQEADPAEEAGIAPEEESTYNAFLAFEICDEMDIEACVVTVTEADGSESSYNEVVLDGELYVLDATEEGGVLEKYTPEEIN